MKNLPTSFSPSETAVLAEIEDKLSSLRYAIRRAKDAGLLVNITIDVGKEFKDDKHSFTVNKEFKYEAFKEALKP